MAKSKNNNIIYIGIAVVVIIIAVVIGIVVMNNGNKGDNGGDNGGTSQNSNTGSSDGGEVSASELNNVDEEIEFGDYDSMYTLSKSIQNGEMLGQVVKIEGIVSHPMSTYSVVQRNAEDSASIGTQFVIVGDAEYPEDGDHIVVTGKIVENSPMVYVIQTLPEFVEIVEE